MTAVTKHSTPICQDAFYQTQSADTRAAPWGPENPAPIVFPSEGNLLDWWRSVEKLAAFVEARNSDEGRRVTLAAGHVTAVLRDEMHLLELPMRRGEPFGRWTDGTKGGDALDGFYSAAPLRVIQKGREEIPEVEWRDINSAPSPG
ncbi:hypothetical protein K504DRAFT_501129 [Pleomassaria siparia CBS 279.74]|uniref:Uncharacterized protein n=1 Tax=Pleomassaria siparia CBS 279.74 TaxID=1314801 RepID=A0A6G1KFG2_9PLEO|nr:hypothetical protein K504DRAFT_501129 [Pleomassaria siparia CBS 279.74]